MVRHACKGLGIRGRKEDHICLSFINMFSIKLNFRTLVSSFLDFFNSVFDNNTDQIIDKNVNRDNDQPSEIMEDFDIQIELCFFPFLFQMGDVEPNDEERKNTPEIQGVKSPTVDQILIASQVFFIFSGKTEFWQLG